MDRLTSGCLPQNNDASTSVSLAANRLLVQHLLAQNTSLRHALGGCSPFLNPVIGESMPWMPSGSDRSGVEHPTELPLATNSVFVENMSTQARDAKDADESSDFEEETCTQTTLMLRNVPKSLSRNSFLEVLDSHGFKGTFDFIYLPVAFGTQNGLGYVLLNFTSVEHARCFGKFFKGFTDWPVTHDKLCQVVKVKGSDHKGLAANIERYRNSPVMHTMVPDEFKPVVFQNGERVPFPEPTVKIHAPPKAPRSVKKSWQQAMKASNTSARSCSGSDDEDTVACPTLMIRDIPQQLSCDVLLNVLDNNGFMGCYDFVYLPLDFDTRLSLGYALINLAEANNIETFKRHFKDFNKWPLPSTRPSTVVSVRRLDHRGLQANIERYRNSPVMHSMVPEEFKPMMFQNGQRVPFPNPTKEVQAPKVSRDVRKAWLQVKKSGKQQIIDGSRHQTAVGGANDPLHDRPSHKEICDMPPLTMAPPSGFAVPLAEAAQRTKHGREREQTRQLPVQQSMHEQATIQPKVGLVPPMASMQPATPPGLPPPGLLSPLQMPPPPGLTEPFWSARAAPAQPKPRAEPNCAATPTTPFLGEGFSILDAVEEDAVVLANPTLGIGGEVARTPSSSLPPLCCPAWAPKPYTKDDDSAALRARNALLELQCAELQRKVKELERPKQAELQCKRGARSAPSDVRQDVTVGELHD